MENFLLIPIQRFISGRKLSCDVFLHLPLNKKNIIVALAGQEIPEDFLKKILAKGYSHLRVPTGSASNKNPDTFPLYENGPQEEIAATKSADATKENPSQEQKAEKEKGTEEGNSTELLANPIAEPATAPPSLTAVATEPQDSNPPSSLTKDRKKPILTVVPKPEEETHTIAEAATTEEKTALSATKEAALEKSKIKSNAAEVEPTTAIKADIATPLEEQKFSHSAELEAITKVSGKKKKSAADPESHFSQDKEDETLNRVKGSKTEEEALSRVKGSKTEEENALNRVKGSQSEKERISLVKNGANETEEEEHSFSTEEENSDEVNRFSGDQAEEKAPPVTIFGSKDEQDDSMVFRLGRRVEAAKESLISGKKIDLSNDKELFMAGAEATLLSSKISEHIIKLSEETKRAKPQEQISLRSQMRTFHEALQKAEKGEEVSAEIKKTLSITEDLSALKKSLAKKDEAEQVIELSDRLSDLMEKREIATQAVEEESKEKKKEDKNEPKNRELPATVSRLAAHLGYSLGYSDVNFLSDLSFGAIMQITQDESSLPKNLDSNAIPELVRAWKSEDRNSVLDDARNILTFLQIYLNDPECDLTQKDFTRKIFDRSIEQLMKDKTVNPWDLGKWVTFMERGLNMESHSICTRASAKALKKTRSLFS